MTASVQYYKQLPSSVTIRLISYSVTAVLLWLLQ